MSLTNEEIKRLTSDSNVKKNDKAKENRNVDVKKNSNNKTITIIVFTMAILATCCSLYMVALTAFERSVSSNEAWIIAGVAICVALSSHLLPALVKGEKNLRLYIIVTLIWSVSVGATLYSHTLFFVKTQNDMADLRSDNSPEIKNIENLIAQKEKWISEQKNRPINVINSDIANEKIRIEQIKPKVCEKCTTAKAKLNSYEIRLSTFEEEKNISLKVEEEKNKIREMQEEIIGKKEEKRTDVLFEKLQRIFPSLSYEVFNLSLSILSAFLVEVFATFFWWYLFPSKNGVRIEGGKGRPSIIVNDKGQKKLFKQPENDIVDAEIVEEEIYLDTGKFAKQKKKELIDFAKNIYENKREGDLKYVMYKNEILPISKEELFVNKLILSIHKKIIPIKVIKTETLHQVKYVNRILKKLSLNVESLVIISYVRNIKKVHENVVTKVNEDKEFVEKVSPVNEVSEVNEKNVRLNYGFEEKNEPVFYSEEDFYEKDLPLVVENKVPSDNLNFDSDFDISALFKGLNENNETVNNETKSIETKSVVKELDKKEDNSNSKELNELDSIKNLLVEKVVDEVEPINIKENKEDESINEQQDPVIKNLTIANKNEFFVFDIKKPLLIEDKEETKEKNKENEGVHSDLHKKEKSRKGVYIDKFLSTNVASNNNKNDPKEILEDSIMDIVFPEQKQMNSGFKEEEKPNESDFSNVITEIFNYENNQS